MQGYDKMSEEVTGKAKGGFARARILSPERTKEISVLANESRKIVKVRRNNSGVLNLGGAQIPCFVLDDDNNTRVITQAGVINGLGMSTGSGAERLASFLRGTALLPFVSNDLTECITNPIKFRPQHGGRAAYGYPATIINDICETILAARRAGALQKQQEHIADQCEILLSGLGRVGIIGLVDEATGYQNDRASQELAEILESFVAKELQPYLKTFQPEFWQELYRVKGKVFLKDNCQPAYVGHWINDIVYHRLAPKILKELGKVNPKQENGRRKHRHYKWLTNRGYSALLGHLWSITFLMSKSSDWNDFKVKLDAKHPRLDKKNEQTPEQN